ncbi:MAG: undecaprenyldiphospho-muramoylpentapeptide beta-N-acetylglucosaminyltransferase [Myxococcales bacterium]|nr:undecaprenyldiphospho-muramoylpentapeptide beta-N-acetylglucosaminyltransferase [Myxococcales bacterium]
MRPILLAGGGTGGHVFPLLGLVEEGFAVRAREAECVFVGTEKGLEAKVVRARGHRLETLAIEPLKGRSVFGALRGGAIAAAATGQAFGLLRRVRPGLVVSIGGYAAGPVALAASALGIPLALLEPNRVAGFTQRLLGPLARRIYVAFPELLGSVGSKGRALGIPLRAGFSPAPSPARAQGEPLSILVMGGSQGAEHLNRTLPAVFGALVADGHELTVLHQAGRGRAEPVREAYARVDAPITVTEFIDDVPAQVRAAHLVVCRAGALTCAELCAIGRAAVLIPYPHAADDHQAKNAEALAEAGAAVALRQEHATVHALVHAIAELSTDDGRRVDMADRARARGVPDAALRIADDVLPLHLDRRAA